MSAWRYVVCARASTERGVWSVSSAIVWRAAGDMTRWVSTPGTVASTWSMRMP